MGRLYYDVFPSEIGWLGALASPKGLRRLSLKHSPQEALEELGPEVAGAEQDPAALESIRHHIDAYFSGDEKALDDISLDLEDAPPFFRASWEACRTIPPGETRSYAWLAGAAGRPGAFRAAGQAMARNRLAIIIPCHRVIGSDGGLHGYGGGLDKKARLLELEAAFSQKTA
jgi:O-6-methylguanine DNA methyltransferase